ncbi:small subunit ribosomal protein S7e [Nematocida minor]|uniref:small subunit ribosomal protein S7e n=1 Tax=Nematocida minor TaxID=1912983 RepID=UPI00221F8AA6|nr:small subunit ribosomal protein S7e [Nematocida minor]KAI5190250.1 small subunit ribosomal protein S7e [Nematocida minor]
MPFKREESSTIKDNREVVEILKSKLEGKNISSTAYDAVEVRQLDINSMLITVVVVPTSILNKMKKEKQAIIEKIEQAANGTVFIIRKRAVTEVEGRGEKKVLSSSVTYVDYQEAVASDLVAPSHIVDRRTVVREDGSKIEKMIIDLKSKKDMTNRFEPMGEVFEHLFSRKAVFQANYY